MAEPSSLDAFIKSATPIIGLLFSGGGIFGFYKIFEKVLDNRNEAAKRRSESENQQAKTDFERRSELEAMVLPLAEKAAALEWSRRDIERLEKERDELKSEKRQLEIDLIQEKTVARGYAVIAELFNDAEGRDYLQRKAAEKHQREAAERAARLAAENAQNGQNPSGGGT